MASGGRAVRVALTGGGSGGHVSPLLAVADALRSRKSDTRFLYIGVRHGTEAVVVPRAGLPLRFAPSRPLPGRKISLGSLGFFFTLKYGTFRAMLHLLRFRPDVILASGGYASAPAVFAATLLRTLTLGLWKIPVYLHEQNAVPGRMNRFAARFATRIGVSHHAALSAFNRGIAHEVGYPVRVDFQQTRREEARRRLGLAADEFYLVAFGGSQGARTLNRALVEALPHLADLPKLRILHASGTLAGPDYDARADTEARLAQLARVPEGYTRVDFAHDLPLHLAAADVAVIRAGAGSLVEACAAGVAAIVIPKANLPGDSQVANARELARTGAVELLYEEPEPGEGGLIEVVEGERLASLIRALHDDPARRAELARRARERFERRDRQAADRIAGEVLALAGGEVEEVNTTPPPRAAGDSDTETPGPWDGLSSPAALRRRVEATLGVRWEQAFAHGRLRDEELYALEDLDYLRYRGAALLAHPAWPMRNEGVKLLGLTRHEEKRPLLAHLLTDRTPAPRLQRLLGGDFVQVGFIRRNVLSAFALHGIWDEITRGGVLAALSDPYYEVRAAACRLLRTYSGGSLEEDAELREALRRLTADRRLEVRWEALAAFGRIAPPEEVLAVGRTNSFAPQAPVREAVLAAYEALLDRFGGDSGAWRDEMKQDLRRMPITSLAFHPDFPLKGRYAMLLRRLNGEDKG